MFEFNEVVRVVEPRNSFSYLAKEGYVAGKIFENDDHENGDLLGYAVYLFDIEEVVCFDGAELISLGRLVDIESVMSGESIRIINQDGMGVIIEDE